MAKKGNFFHKWYYENKWNGLMSVEELGLKYQITNACMFYNSLLSCLPRFWKHLVQNSARLLSVTGSNMEQFDKIRNCIKPCKTFYNIFLKKYTERLINSQNKWEKLLIGNLFTLCQMTVLLIIYWKCFSTNFSTEPSLQIHFCINVS